MMKCLICNTEVKTTDDKFMLAFEVPYINLFLHRCCYNSVKSNIIEWAEENKTAIYDMCRNRKK